MYHISSQLRLYINVAISRPENVEISLLFGNLQTKRGPLKFSQAFFLIIPESSTPFLITLTPGYCKSFQHFPSPRKSHILNPSMFFWLQSSKVVCIPILRYTFSFLKSASHLSNKIPFICFDESLLKMMKSAFYFILKAFSVLKIFNFLSWLFGHAKKRLD